MANGLFPSFVRIAYHSPWGAHLCTIPTRQWSPGTGQGTFKAWDDSDVDADTMINGLVDVLATIMPEATPAVIHYDYYTIFNFEDEDSLPVPVAEAALAQVGGFETPGWYKAVETTITYHTTGFGIFKLVLLDSASANNFDKLGPLDSVDFKTALDAEITVLTNAWAGRDNLRPANFTQVARTLNEKLRRSYNMN